MGEDTWREAWNLKVFGYQNTCRAAYENMKARGKGVIINVIGAAGERPIAGYIAGSAGNASLMAFTRALGGGEHHRRGPGGGDQPGPDRDPSASSPCCARPRSANSAIPERWREVANQDYPAGQPEHIGDMVAFLASDLSANTTGTIITIDGGASHRARF